jgi:hypothetical protein
MIKDAYSMMILNSVFHSCLGYSHNLGGKMAVIHENNVIIKQSTGSYTLGGNATLYFVGKICQYLPLELFNFMV